MTTVQFSTVLSFIQDGLNQNKIVKTFNINKYTVTRIIQHTCADGSTKALKSPCRSR